MKTLMLSVVTFVLMRAVVFAQEPTLLDGYMDAGMEVSGVRAPFYDEDGNLQARLYGEHAKVLEGGIAEITNLRIDLFQQGAIVLTIFTPQCFSRMTETQDAKMLSIESDGDVLIDMEQMTISGRGFRFSSGQNKFEILHDAKVLVRESMKDIDGLNL